MKVSTKHTVVIAVCLIIILGAGLAAQKLLLSDPGMYAVVQVNGETVAELDLSEDRELMMSDEYGNYNMVKVSDGCVSVTEANCSDRICVKTGAQQDEGAIIACLPHGLIIYIQSGDE